MYLTATLGSEKVKIAAKTRQVPHRLAEFSSSVEWSVSVVSAETQDEDE
jgi:hypothetical protein